MALARRMSKLMLDKISLSWYNSDMKKEQKTTSLRLTPKAMCLLKMLAEKLGVTQTAIIEMALREFAEKRDVK